MEERKGMKEYNKLVRDNIIDIMANNGTHQFGIQILRDDKLFLKALNEKLLEEVHEYLDVSSIDAGNLNMDALVEELADIHEVLESIKFLLRDSFDVSFYKIASVKSKKRAEKGGFNKRIFLIGAE